MQKYFNKQKIADILLTALVSAGLAFLQSIIVYLSGADGITADPVIAGGIGGAIRICQKV